MEEGSGSEGGEDKRRPIGGKLWGSSAAKRGGKSGKRKNKKKKKKKKKKEKNLPRTFHAQKVLVENQG